MTARSGIQIGDAAISILRDHEGDIGSAVEQIVRLQEKATKGELLEALAYAACQVGAYRRIANEDAALAIRQIESIVSNYFQRRGEANP